MIPKPDAGAKWIGRGRFLSRPARSVREWPIHLAISRSSALCWRAARVRGWSIFLAGVPLALTWGLGHGASDAVRVVGAALITVALGFGAVYFLTPFDLNWHINTSTDRLIIQLWPSVLLVAALQLGPRSGAERWIGFKSSAP